MYSLKHAGISDVWQKTPKPLKFLATAGAAGVALSLGGDLYERVRRGPNQNIQLQEDAKGEPRPQRRI